MRGPEGEDGGNVPGDPEERGPPGGRLAGPLYHEPPQRRGGGTPGSTLRSSLGTGSSGSLGCGWGQAMR